MCMEKGDELQAEIDKQFSVWTDVINEKSEYLYKLFMSDDEPKQPGEMFDEAFLQRIRDEYDELKDAGMLTLVDPMVKQFEIIEMCPDDVKAKQSMLESLEDILEDGLSYKEWLRARANKLCEVETYSMIEDMNMADSESA